MQLQEGTSKRDYGTQLQMASSPRWGRPHVAGGFSHRRVYTYTIPPGGAERVSIVFRSPLPGRTEYSDRTYLLAEACAVTCFCRLPGPQNSL